MKPSRVNVPKNSGETKCELIILQKNNVLCNMTKINVSLKHFTPVQVFFCVYWMIWKNGRVLVGFHTARQKRVCLFRVIPPQRSGSKSRPSTRHCLSPGPSEGHAGIYRLSAGGSSGKLGISRKRRCASVHFITFFISYLLHSLCSDRSNDAREHKHLLKST